MKRVFVLLYGAFAYLLFLIVFSYLTAFLLGLFVPKSINDLGVAAPGGLLGANAVNLALIVLFGFLHSLLARDWVKALLYRILPQPAERSTYVLQSSLCLALAMWLWQPIDTVIWQVSGWGSVIAYGFFGLGAGLVLLSTFIIDHFELFGLRQIWTQLRGQQMPEPVFKTPVLYRVVRHPMQLGIIILLFSTPLMTAGHMLFAASMTAYIFVGLYFEERALVRQFGDRYLAYKSQVPMLFPRLLRKSDRQQIT